MTGTKTKRRRPLTRAQKWVIWLSLLLLAVGLGNLGRALGALHVGDTLPDLPATVSWDYVAAAGSLWAVVLWTCAIGLVRFRRWARIATLGAATLFQFHVWVDHLVFDASPFATQSRVRDLVTTILFLALIWGILNAPAVRRVFAREQ